MTKKAVFLAITLIVAGLILGAVALFVVGFDFTNLSTTTYTEVTHTVEDPFQNICLDTEVGKVRIVHSANSTCRVDCRESENYTFSVSVVDNTLTVKVNDSRAWYEHIGIHILDPEVTVYLSEAAYESLTVESTTGSVLVEKGFSFQNANVQVTTGEINWSGSDASSLTLQTTTGQIRLTDATTEDLTVKITTGNALLANSTSHTLSAAGSTGDLRFDRFDARTINIKLTTGDVTGTLLTPKQFITSTTTGDVQVPQGANTADTCKISVTTGDIHIELAK